MSVPQEELDSVMGNMELLLREVELLRGRCTHSDLELARHITALRLENRTLTEKYTALDQELQEASETIEQLLDTKHALQAKGRQAEKLARRL